MSLSTTVGLGFVVTGLVVGALISVFDLQEMRLPIYIGVGPLLL